MKATSKKEIIRLLAVQVEALWKLALAVEQHYKAMSHVSVGDYVMELTTARRRSAGVRIGKLLEIKTVKRDIFPTKYVIRTLYGRKIIWENCQFISLAKPFELK